MCALVYILYYICIHIIYISMCKHLFLYTALSLFVQQFCALLFPRVLHPSCHFALYVFILLSFMWLATCIKQPVAACSPSLLLICFFSTAFLPLLSTLFSGLFLALPEWFVCENKHRHASCICCPCGMPRSRWHSLTCFSGIIYIILLFSLPGILFELLLLSSFWN